MAEPNNQTQTVGKDKAAWDKALSSGDFETLEYILITNVGEETGNSYTSATTFVKPNLGTLTKEVNAYGLDATNPFFTFLKKYKEINGAITIFNDASKYNTLHNLLAKNVIDETQLRDTCTKEKQLPILWNNSLWDNPTDDITWLVNTYAWFMNSGWGGIQITDAAILDLLKEVGETKLTYEVRSNLRKLCFFTTALKDAAGEIDVVKSIRTGAHYDAAVKAYQKAASGGFPDVSSKLQSADMVERQIKVLDELVRKNNRDSATGRYKRQTGEENVDNADAVAKVVAGEKIAQRAGVDFSKLKTQLGADEYSALVDYAKSLSRR